MTEFAHDQGWTLDDGRIYFPHLADGDAGPGGKKDAWSGAGGDGDKEIMSHVVGYARELESIV